MKKALSATAIFIFLCLLSSHNNKKIEPVNIKIGALFSITGAWSSLGVTSREAMDLAIQEINNRMEETGSHYRFSSVVYDTRLDTTAAKTAIREALSQNIHFMVGPQSSVELEAVSSFANQHDILLVSQGSTASNLAIPGDAIFRFCPGDASEGDAMAQAIYSSGRRVLISISANDPGNLGLQKAVTAAFLKRGGTVEALPAFRRGSTDFTSTLADLKSRIVQKTREAGAEKVGIYLASFDGVKDLFHQASSDTVFKTVQWYGGDAIALNSALLADVTAASFAAAGQFFAPSFGLPQQVHPDMAEVAASIKSKTSIEADAYALAVYDAMWVIARTVTAFPEPPRDFHKVKDIFQKEANHFYGITGPTYLNAAGDRSNGSFYFWAIVREGETYSWKLIGKSL